MSAPVVAEAEAQQSSATTTTIKSIKDDPYANKTVIAVNQSVVVDDPGVSYGPSGGVGTSGAANTSLGVPSSKQPVGRSLSNRSSVFAKGSLQGGGGGKKLGHRRVGDDGEITYKKFETTQLIGSIQIGLQYAVGSEVNIPDRDLLMQVKQKNRSILSFFPITVRFIGFHVHRYSVIFEGRPAAENSSSQLHRVSV